MGLSVYVYVFAANNHDQTACCDNRRQDGSRSGFCFFSYDKVLTRRQGRA